MFQSRLRSIAGNLGILSTKCEYFSECENFSMDSETCTKAADKTFCGTYRRIVEGITNE